MPKRKGVDLVKRKLKWDINFAIELRVAGLSYNRLADFFGVSKPTIIEGLKTHVPKNLQYILEKGFDKKKHKENLQVILDAKHMEALKEVTVEKMENESAKDCAQTAKLLMDQSRLNANESTANVAHSFARLVEQSESEDGL